MITSLPGPMGHLFIQNSINCSISSLYSVMLSYSLLLTLSFMCLKFSSKNFSVSNFVNSIFFNFIFSFIFFSSFFSSCISFSSGSPIMLSLNENKISFFIFFNIFFKYSSFIGNLFCNSITFFSYCSIHLFLALIA